MFLTFVDYGKRSADSDSARRGRRVQSTSWNPGPDPKTRVRCSRPTDQRPKFAESPPGPSASIQPRRRVPTHGATRRANFRNSVEDTGPASISCGHRSGSSDQGKTHAYLGRAYRTKIKMLKHRSNMQDQGFCESESGLMYPDQRNSS